MKYREELMQAINCLDKAGITEAKNDAWILFETVFDIDRTRYFLVMNDEVDDEEKTALYNEYVMRRKSREPLQHITGHQVFMGYDFKVTKDVLIPRFDTEILVDKVFEYMRHLHKIMPDKRIKLLDMCTGSGCIGISLGLLAKENGIEVSLFGADISDAALEVAGENASRLGCDIHFIKSDLFDNINESDFDIIVSNPPYIAGEVIEGLDLEVKEHEPYIALCGGDDGLSFYRRITEEGINCLAKDGRIYYEIGYDQADAVNELFAEHGFVDSVIIKDLAGLDRVAVARKE